MLYWSRLGVAVFGPMPSPKNRCPMWPWSRTPSTRSRQIWSQATRIWDQHCIIRSGACTRPLRWPVRHSVSILWDTVVIIYRLEY
jgi:hypothetical protein